MTDKPEAVALEPCPLCGDPMMDDNANTFGHSRVDADCLLASFRWHDGESYVTAWNTRATPAQPDASALVAALKGMVNALDMSTGTPTEERVIAWFSATVAARAALTAWEAQHG